MLRGNPSKLSSQQLRDGVHPEVEIPRPPRHLLPAARKEWQRIGPELEKLGLVSHLDMAALAAYCQSYARWVAAEHQLKELGIEGCIDTTPSGYRQIGVWLQVSNRCVDQMHKFMAEFGLTPSSRSRVQPSHNQLELFDDDSDGGKPSTSRFFRD